MTVMVREETVFVTGSSRGLWPNLLVSPKSNLLLYSSREDYDETKSIRIFRMLADGIERDCAHLSSVTEMERHPCYRYLVSMGWQVLPLILEHIKNDTSIWWFSILHEITNANPVKTEHEGVVRMMAHDWLKWAGWDDDNGKLGVGA